jgi:hypothetical protein
MFVPDLPSPSLPASADAGGTAAVRAGAAEEPRVDFHDALEQLLESVGSPPVDSEEPRADFRDALGQMLESVGPLPVDGEEPETNAPALAVLVPSALPSAEPGLVPPGTPPAPEGIPAPEQVPIGIGRPAPESPLAAVEAREAMAATARDTFRAPPAVFPSEARVAAESPPVPLKHPGAADAAAAPVAPESAEAVVRPEPVPTGLPAPEDRSGEGTESRERRTAPARLPEGAVRPDGAMREVAERRDAIAPQPVRPNSSARRATSEARAFNAATPQSEPGPAEAPTAAAEREIRDPRAGALRPNHDAERPATEPGPEVASPVPRAATFTAGPPSGDPPMAPLAQTPAAGTPAEALPVHAEWLAARGGGTVRLRLHPPELGEVELSVRVRGSAVQVSIQTENAEAGRAALDGRELLFEALASRELRVEQMVVRSPDGVTTNATPGDSGDGSSEHLSEHPEGSSERDGSGPQSRPAAAPPEPQSDDHHAASGNAVDLRV